MQGQAVGELLMLNGSCLQAPVSTIIRLSSPCSQPSPGQNALVTQLKVSCELSPRPLHVQQPLGWGHCKKTHLKRHQLE